MGHLLIGPEGETVYTLTDLLVPLCPIGEVPFPPGTEVGAGLILFEGTLYTRDLHPYAAPPGDYTIVATFSWWKDSDRERQQVLTRRLTFQWAAP